MDEEGKREFPILNWLIHNLMFVYSTAGITEQIKLLQGLFGLSPDVWISLFFFFFFKLWAWKSLRS